MTARRRVTTPANMATPGLDYLRRVVRDSKAKPADRLKSALVLAVWEKTATTREFEPGVRQRDAEAATEASDWDSLLRQ